MLHLGEDLVLRICDIVMMVDLSRSDLPDTRAFLSAAQAAGAVYRVSKEAPKTAVVTHRQNKRTVYLSPISSATLLKRVGIPE